jgi:hypothetical protein
MSATPPLARLVEEVASQAALVTDLLPGGWHHLYVPGVDRPVVLGPGGVFVLDVRHQATLPIGVQNDRPWANDHRNQMSTPRLTAELSSQLLSWACGIEINVTPVIVLAGADSADEIVPRPDGVDIVHQHMLDRWLSNLPAELDAETIALIVEHVAPTPTLRLQHA